ncbi:hypothetical protein ACFO3D_15280 [Virgibacillus kekensis]|uniref:Group-specific protein n=1 Tax=Virgibacillus kekensis TaxID=202261 RepID=A0ABV9DL50_9BACI
MGKCNIDHSRESVITKLENQEEFLPGELAGKTRTFLTDDHSQETLNDLFHLLKKYDLASEEERKDRDQQIRLLIG